MQYQFSYATSNITQIKLIFFLPTSGIFSYRCLSSMTTKLTPLQLPTLIVAFSPPFIINKK